MSPVATRGIVRASEAAGAPVTERVLRHIRRLIQRRRLRPGDRLPTERELAREMGVSRPTVRAGLRSLAAMGLLQARRGAGTFIPEAPTLDSEPLSLLAALHDFSVDEIFEARSVLEVSAVGLSAQRATPDQTAGMAELLAGMFAALDDPQAFLVQDVRFHRAVAAGSNNSVLAALVEMVSALLYERRRTTVERARDLRESAEMHRRIYECIRRRDSAAARAAMADHLRLALAGWAAEDARAARRDTRSHPPHGRRRAQPRKGR